MLLHFIDHHLLEAKSHRPLVEPESVPRSSSDDLKKTQTGTKPKNVKNKHQHLSPSTNLALNVSTKQNKTPIANLQSLSLEPQTSSSYLTSSDNGNLKYCYAVYSFSFL